MTSWEVSKYLISAKKDIDSMMFIEENIKDIPLAIRRDYVERIKDHFYINCCVVIDAFLDSKNIINTKEEKFRSNWKSEHSTVKQLYYERDKNSAHIDETYKMKNYESFSKLIIGMKSQIRSVVNACAEILPNKLTINYFPHDKVLFRLINKVNNDEEQKINKSKYVDHKEGYAVGNLLKPRRVVYDLKELRGLSEEEKQELAVLVEAGLNFYESQQNLEDFYILINCIHNKNLWTFDVENRVQVYKKLKHSGIIDQYDRPKYLKVFTKEAVDKAYNMANYIWGFGMWDKKSTRS